MTSRQTEACGTDLSELERQFRNVADRQEILDCLYRYTRAVDRHDWPALHDIYHADGVANHGDFVGSAQELTEWLEKLYTNLEVHVHNVTNHVAEISGDVAHAESVAIVVVKPKAGDQAILSGSRYIDRLERRDGRWKIALRRIVSDWACKAEALPLQPAYPHGATDKSDLSYMRPLALSDELSEQLQKR